MGLDCCAWGRLGGYEHEIDEENADEAETAPYEKHLGAEIGIAGARVDEVGCTVCYGKGS